ncbi:hypothetical protein GCM10009642_22580 [Nocardiopsis metallicus]
MVIRVRATQAGARARGTDGRIRDFISAESLVAGGGYPVMGPGETHPAGATTMVGSGTRPRVQLGPAQTR